MRSLALLLLLTGCTSLPKPWPHDPIAGFAAAKAAHADCVVYFALPGRELSDRMENGALPDPAVLQALRDGDFHSVWVDGLAQQRMYANWVGSGEGMGICVIDADGRVYAARPGPQDPPELAAYLRLCAAARTDIQSARAALQQHPDDRKLQLRLARLLLELGCRRETEEWLIKAAMAGEIEAKHLLGRLAALEGRLQEAHRWLVGVPRTPGVQVTEGYLLYKERRHAEAIDLLGKALQQDLGAERQRALLFYGKALHEAKRDDEASKVLEGLRQENTGSTFEAAADHTLAHIADPSHTHAN